MQDGFVKVAARTPEVRVADVDFNVKAVVQEVRKSFSLDGARVIVLPELALTGYTCEDLFWQDALLDAAEKGVADVARATSRVDALVLVGAPVRAGGKLYNCAVALSRGRVLGMNPDHKGNTIVEADVPQSELYGYCTTLRSITGGAGSFEYTFARYEQAPADVQEKEIEARAEEAAK